MIFLSYNEYFEVKDIYDNITNNYNPVLINKDVNELQGAALLARELGAKVIGEYPSK